MRCLFEGSIYFLLPVYAREVFIRGGGMFIRGQQHNYVRQKKYVHKKH